MQIRDEQGSLSYIDQFRELLENLALLTNRYFPKANAIPYVDESLPIFSSFSVLKRVQILKDTKEYLSSWLALESESYDLTNDRQYLWRALKDRGMRLGSDVMDIVSGEDIIEVYGIDGIHLWFNLRMMELCSHSIEAVRCLPWYERYKRSEEVDEACHRAAHKVLSFSEPKVIDPQIPIHIAEEINSTQSLKVQLDFKKLAPVYDRVKKEKVGFIITSKAEVIAAQKLVQNPSFDSSNYREKREQEKGGQVHILEGYRS